MGTRIMGMGILGIRIERVAHDSWLFNMSSGPAGEF